MSSRKQVFRTLQGLIVTVVLPVSANEMPGRDIAATCVACHGADGIGKAEQYPNLQGQGQSYLVKQLRDFKTGVRKDSSMNRIAESLSDADMKTVAEFFTQVR